MADTLTFDLWLEFEHYASPPDHDSTDDFFNMQIRLSDGRRYALNVWTFAFLQRARYPWPYEKGVGIPAIYVLPPDLFVERIDRPTLEHVVTQLLLADEIRPEWLCPSEEELAHDTMAI